MKNYDKNLKKENTDKKLLIRAGIVAICSLVLLFVPIILAVSLPMKDWQKGLLVISGGILAIVGLFYAVELERIAGYYVCKKCGEKYVPTRKVMWFAPHMGRIRWMKCPNCGKRSWQKKTLKKD